MSFKLNKQIIDEIKAGNELAFSGSEARVYLTEALALKEFKYFIHQKRLKRIKDVTNHFRDEMGVNTPEIVDARIVSYTEDKFGKKYYKNNPYILMERAKGRPVMVGRPENIVKYFNLEDFKGIEDIAYYKMTSDYSNDMIMRLYNASQEQFDTFANNVSNILTSGDALIDAFGENIYYDKDKGFTLLDFRVLDEYSNNIMRKDKNYYLDKHLRSDVSRVMTSYVTDLYCSATDETEEMLDEKIEPIVKKTTKALSSCPAKITDEDYPAKFKLSMGKFL